jgi:hypothetical protein
MARLMPGPGVSRANNRASRLAQIAPRATLLAAWPQRDDRDQRPARTEPATPEAFAHFRAARGAAVHTIPLSFRRHRVARSRWRRRDRACQPAVWALGGSSYGYEHPLTGSERLERVRARGRSPARGSRCRAVRSIGASAGPRPGAGCRRARRQRPLPRRRDGFGSQTGPQMFYSRLTAPATRLRAERRTRAASGVLTNVIVPSDGVVPSL